MLYELRFNEEIETYQIKTLTSSWVEELRMRRTNMRMEYTVIEAILYILRLSTKMDVCANYNHMHYQHYTLICFV